MILRYLIIPLNKIIKRQKDQYHQDYQFVQMNLTQECIQYFLETIINAVQLLKFNTPLENPMRVLINERIGQFLFIFEHKLHNQYMIEISVVHFLIRKSSINCIISFDLHLYNVFSIFCLIYQFFSRWQRLQISQIYVYLDVTHVLIYNYALVIDYQIFKTPQQKNEYINLFGYFQFLTLEFLKFVDNLYNKYAIYFQKPQDETTSIKRSSHEALVKSNDAKVTMLSNKIKTLIDQAFLQADLTLTKAQALNLKNINSKYKMTSGLKKKGDAYPLTYQQPSNPEKINSTSDYFRQFGNLITHIDSYLLSFSLEQSSNIQMIARIQKPHITSVFSPITLLSTIDIEQRPYYTEHIQQNNTRLIGKPFISASTQKVSFMISQTIYDQLNKKDIIMFMGFLFDNLSKYLTLNNIKFVLCTLSGIIVSSNINNTLQVQTLKELTYLYHQSIFPFNKDDWEQMNRYLKNETYKSNCQQSFIKFCRNLNGIDIQLEAQFVQTNFIQIIFNDLSFTKQEDHIFKSNIKELFSTIINYNISFFSCCLLILVLSTVYMTRIIKPAAEMIKVVNLQVQNQSLDNLDEQYNPDVTNIFSEFQKSFLQLIQRHINYRKQKIEKFNKQLYPPYSYNIVLNTKGIEQIQGRPQNPKHRGSVELREKFAKNSNANLLLTIIYLIQDQ
ncbi:hypothetical protein pb186bvf_015297 [Paramecium bursaria]